MSEQEKRMIERLEEKLEKMTEEQKKLWFAVADGMMLAAEIETRQQ